ncbi:MAG: hypothetical protein HQL94_05755 [Magnetococcales bacterium]|nr:hypothetical protein [Magnetococcales bacterium]
MPNDHMANHPETLLTVILPDHAEGALTYETSGRTWQATPNTPLPKSAYASTLWQRINDDWSNRRTILEETGEQLGRWLFDEHAFTLLKNHAARWMDGPPLARVFLRVPPGLADIAWEVAAVEGFPFLATHPAFTLVRHVAKNERMPPPVPGQAGLKVVAVSHHQTSDWLALNTGAEATRIHEVITNAGWSARFNVVLGACRRIGSNRLKSGRMPSSIPVGPGGRDGGIFS